MDKFASVETTGQGEGRLAMLTFYMVPFCRSLCILDWDAGLLTARLLSPGCEKGKTEIKISWPVGCYANSEPFGTNLSYGDRDSPTIRKESRD